MSEAKLEPWQWPESHWRGLVNHVRAGRTYRPKAWKDGKRCAFALSFDADHETRLIVEFNHDRPAPALRIANASFMNYIECKQRRDDARYGRSTQVASAGQFRARYRPLLTQQAQHNPLVQFSHKREIGWLRFRHANKTLPSTGWDRDKNVAFDG